MTEDLTPPIEPSESSTGKQKDSPSPSGQESGEAVAFTTPCTYQVTQESFQGPLDKLLELVRDHKIDIFTVSLAVIANEYLAYVNSMEKHNLDEVGDFLVIAGHLMVLKSRNLLPTETLEEEDQEPVDEQQLLLKRLKDYERFREVADLLRKAEEERHQLYWREKPPPSVEQKDVVEFYEVNVFDLASAFKRVLEEIGEARPNLIQGEEFTIDEKMAEIQLLLYETGEMCLSLYLKSMRSRIEAIVTFLALLELIRLLKVRAKQSAMLGDIWIYRAEEIKHDSAGEVEIAYTPEGAGFVGDSGTNAPVDLASTLEDEEEPPLLDDETNPSPGAVDV